MTREEAINEIKSWDFLEGKEIEAIHTLIPELRESEDERIRKAIIDALYSHTNSINILSSKGYSMDDVIAYLEKQKECVVDNNKTSAEEDERIRARLIEYFNGFLEGYEDCYKDGGCVKWEGLDVKSILAWLEKQKEQKPEHFELKAGKWYICHRAFCCRADRLTVKEGERFMCEKDGVVKGFVIKEPEKYFKECSAPAPMEDEQKEQKPVQSEEEKEYVRTLKGLVSDFIRDSGGGITDVEYYQNICDWLDGRHIEQKPVVTHGETYHVDTLGTQQVIAGKMPQKSAEWSEEDKDKVVQYLHDRDGGMLWSKATEITRDILDMLRPSWKPSEAQLMALHSVIDDESDTIENEQLKSLYNDLKKLGVEEEPEYYQHFDPDC